MIKDLEYIDLNQSLGPQCQEFLENCYIYFIVDQSNRIKIGKTEQSPKTRMDTLQTGHPEFLILLGTLPGTTIHERYLHKKFKHLKVRGEWFRGDKELWQYIFDNCDPP